MSKCNVGDNECRCCLPDGTPVLDVVAAAPEGLEVSEIAVLMGLTPRHVRRILAQAVAKVRRQVNPRHRN